MGQKLSLGQVKNLVIGKMLTDFENKDSFMASVAKERIRQATSLIDIAIFLEDNYVSGMFYILYSITEDYPDKENDLDFILGETEA